jgi:hypothetical protein
MNTESMISLPVTMSSPEMSLAFFCPTSSPNARMPLASAARMPCSWVPPSGVGTVLQYQEYAPSDHSGQATAHSTRPCVSPFCEGKSWLPLKNSAVTHSRPATCSRKWSDSPPGNWNTASAGTSSAVSEDAHFQRISTPANR